MSPDADASPTGEGGGEELRFGPFVPEELAGSEGEGGASEGVDALVPP